MKDNDFHINDLSVFHVAEDLVHAIDGHQQDSIGYSTFSPDHPLNDESTIVLVAHQGGYERRYKLTITELDQE